MSSTILGMSRSNALLAAGVAGAVVIGSCIYLDYKRTHAPDYKEKIRQKRRAQAGRAAGAGSGMGGAGMPSAPDPTDPSAMQAFFLQEVQIGEELLATGNTEQGAVHIANAVMMCGQSQQLLSIFQQTLSEEQYRAVLQELPRTRERLADMFGAKADEAENERPAMQYVGDGPPPAQIQELIDDTDDLE